MFTKVLTTFVLVVSLAVLSACNSAEERAEKHFQSGVELIEAGDEARGLIELRNALKLNNRHAGARLLYAKTVLDQGKVQDAYGQYLRHVEFYPEDLEARRALAEISMETRNWPEVERHLKVAVVLAPQDFRVRVVQNAMEYRKAVEDEDKTAQAQAADTARALLEEDPTAGPPRQVLIDSLLRQGELRGALAELDTVLAQTPDNLPAHQLRLSVLNELGDVVGVESQLVAMMENFPDNIDVRSALLRWYMSRQEMDKAEAFLRQLAAQSEGDALAAANTDLVRFLLETQSPDAARAELARLIEQGGGNGLYRAVRAQINFDTGARDEAVAEMEAILDGAESSDQTRRFKVMLARFRWETGNAVGARELVEEVLAEDSTQVDAMKLKASWLTVADQTDEAIILLRAALEQSPQDPGIMRLMAAAYERSGNRELMGDMLSLAVEASNKAPAESLAYARFLLSEDKAIPAERVLVDALRLAPGNLLILKELAQIYINLEDWPRALQVADTFGRSEDPLAKGLEKDLRLAVLQAQDRDDEVLRFLEDLSGDSTVNDRGVRAAMVATHLKGDRLPEALNEVDKALEAYPEDPGFTALRARLLERTGARDESIAIYRALLEKNPKVEGLWRELYATLRRADRGDEARKVLEDGLAELGDAPNLLWIKASLAEQDGDIDGAIAIYEKLYERNSANLIVANNLASLLATYRDDPAELERAHTIARRLRESPHPFFRDTYGWIAYLRGDYDAALEHLEPAAAQGTPEATIYYHLGMTYLALGRTADAEAQLRRAIEIATPADTRPEIETARAELQKLVSGAQTPAETDSGDQ